LVVRFVLAYWMPGWRWFAPIANFCVPVLGVYLMVQVYFLILFSFAPRGKKIAGWFFYVPLMLWSTIMFLLRAPAHRDQQDRRIVIT